MARWCRGYWSSQGRVEKGWNWVAECNIQRPSQAPSLVVFIRHIISEVLQYRRHPFRARRHPWSEPDAILGGSPLNRDFANIGEPECMLDNTGERYTMSSSSYPPTEPDAILGHIGERYTMSSSSYPPTEPDAILGGLYSPHVPGKGMPIARRILVIPGKGRERVELGGRV